MAADPITADQFLVRYTSDSFSVGKAVDEDAAVREFKDLSSHDRYEVLNVLAKNPIKNEWFIQRLLPPLLGSSPVDQMKIILAKTRKTLPRGAIKDDKDLWERRYKVGLMLYQLGQIRRSFHWNLVENLFEGRGPVDDLASQNFLQQSLVEFYRDTRPHPSEKANDLFDTDGDDVFDKNDKFPLDPNFWADSDGDDMPDPLDPQPNNPKIWHDLKEGEIRTKWEWDPKGKKVALWVSLNQGEVLLTLPIKFHPVNATVQTSFSNDWTLVAPQVDDFINSRSPAGIRIHVISYDDAASQIKITDRVCRESSLVWSLPVLQDSIYGTPITAHEAIHLLPHASEDGPIDLYGESFTARRDHVLQPGFSLLSLPNDLMRRHSKKSTLRPEVMKIAVGLAGRNPELDLPPSSKILNAANITRLWSKAQEVVSTRKDLDSLIEDYKRRLNLERGTKPLPIYYHLAGTIAAAYFEKAIKEVDWNKKIEYYRLFIDYFEIVTQMNPQDAVGWVLYARLHQDFNQSLGEPNNAMTTEQRQFLFSSKNNVAQNQKNALWMSLAMAPGEFKTWVILAQTFEQLGGFNSSSFSEPDKESIPYYQRQINAAQVAIHLSQASAQLENEEAFLMYARGFGHLGDVYVKAADKKSLWKSQIDLTEEALRINPKSSEGWRLLADTYQKLQSPIIENDAIKRGEYRQEYVHALRQIANLNPVGQVALDEMSSAQSASE